MLFSILLQAIPGSGAIVSGIDSATNSVHVEINRILSAIIAVLFLVIAGLIKHFLSDKKASILAIREDLAKEQAINEGAHQNMMKAKNDHLHYLTIENEKLKIDFVTIAKDNTEAFKQMAVKVGSFVEGQAVVAANQEKNKSEILLEVSRLFSQLRSS